jgi:hypothetical protein
MDHPNLVHVAPEEQQLSLSHRAQQGEVLLFGDRTIEAGMLALNPRHFQSRILEVRAEGKRIHIWVAIDQVAAQRLQDAHLQRGKSEWGTRGLSNPI